MVFCDAGGLYYAYRDPVWRVRQMLDTGATHCVLDHDSDGIPHFAYAGEGDLITYARP